MVMYYVYSRTNRFKVLDIQEFVEEFERLGYDIRVDEDRSVYLLDGDGIGWVVYDDNDLEVDVVQRVAKHLADDSVAIFMSVGHEELRYLTGISIAVDSTGTTKTLDMYDIYQVAAETFQGKEITLAEF